MEAIPDLIISISPLVVIAGPTASGKSALALALGARYGGEIVNCDSLQMYRGMDIGTAKPDAAERALLPHWLFDVRNPDEVYTAGEYSRQGRAMLREIAGRGRLPMVIGGAGFYLRALLEGLFDGPARSEPVRERLSRWEGWRAGTLHRVLACWDRDSAARIHARDVNKLIRALEIMVLERQPLREAHRRERRRLEGFRILKLGLNPPREALRERIGLRARQMFERGLLEEVKGLAAAGFGREAKAMEAVGYRQAWACLAGEMTREQAVAETALRTAQYAKRQMTWFRRDAEMVWLEGFGDEPGVREQAGQRLEEFLRAGRASES